MNNTQLEEVWKLRMELRNKANELYTKVKVNEEKSLRLRLESQDVKLKQKLKTFYIEPSIEQLIKTYGNDVNEKLEFHSYCNECIAMSEHLRNESIKISKEWRNIIAESDDIWIKAVLKFYIDTKIKWIYNEEKNDFSCELENGEIYSPQSSQYKLITSEDNIK